AVQIEPQFPEFWGTVRTGFAISVQEGARIVGYATITDVTRPQLFTPDVTTFVCQAREFCAFVKEAPQSLLPQRLLNARHGLIALLRAAVLLPSIEPPDTPEPASPNRPEGWEAFVQFDTYWEVFDPYDMQEPVAGSISDDLLDIFGDVHRGLQLWERGEHAA